MATIDTGRGHSGKKSVDANIPLVPFIDLLLCCVMFLLVTAVWNELASMDASLASPGPSVDEVTADSPQLQVLLNAQGFVVSSAAGDSVAIPRLGDELDYAKLSERLGAYRTAYPNADAITVAPDDGIPFDAVVATMDAIRARGFASITL